MRYTTIIDVTEVPEVWRNPSTCRLYLWLVLKSGYHDQDRDQVKASLRTIAMKSGLSLSAVRHGLKILQRVGLTSSMGDYLTVTKFVMEQTITTRAKTKQQQQQQQQTAHRDEQQRNLEKNLRQERRLREAGSDQTDAQVVAMFEQYQAEVANCDGVSKQIREAYLVRMKTRYETIKASKS